MKRLKRTVILALCWSLPLPALACDLDDCHLPVRLHATGLGAGSQPKPVQDQWSWMNHELAVARDALAHGRRAFALEMAHNLFSALDAQGKPVAATRGVESVQDFFESLQELVVQCDGRPLQQLQLVLRTTE